MTTENIAAETNRNGSDVGIEVYLDLVKRSTNGPQVEGLSEEEISLACQDTRTTFLELPSSDNGEAVKIPFLVPLEYASWLNRNFFVEHGYALDSLRYCAIPPAALKMIDKDAVAEALQAASSTYDTVFDHEASDTYIEDLFGLEAVDDLMTQAGTPAATFHYRSELQPLAEGLERYQKNEAVRDVMPADLDDNFDRIWEIYSDRFQDLVDDHPIAGALSREDLAAALRSDGVIIKAFFDERGVIQSFGYLVTNLDSCPWLNKDYFDKASEGRPYAYLPGIATAKDYEPAVSALIMNDYLHEWMPKYGASDLTFECSNLSAKYIPKLIKMAFDFSGMVSFPPFTETRHDYRVLKKD